MIVVADDDQMVRDTITATLERGRYESIACEDGAEVLEILETVRPDLILMDIQMPKLDGITACRRVRENAATKDIPVILISGYADAETIVEGLDRGADDYVVKPFQPSVLLAKVRAMLRARRSQQSPGEIVNLGLGSVFDEHFVILEKLGHGGMGVVYRTKDTRTHEEVVVKIQDCRDVRTRGKSARRFHREVAALAEVDHPNVVRMLSAGLHGDHHYCVMEYVNGHSLRQVLENNGALSIPEAVRVAGAVAEGLRAVHDAGFIHRDVKPENILIDVSGEIRIGDFGIVFPVEVDVTRLTQDGALVGTPLYMAPEQADGEVDPRSDLYSLGVVLYEMLTSEHFRKYNAGLPALLRQMNQMPEPPSLKRNTVPKAVDDLCMKACHPTASMRYQTAAEFVDALRFAFVE